MVEQDLRRESLQNRFSESEPTVRQPSFRPALCRSVAAHEAGDMNSPMNVRICRAWRNPARIAETCTEQPQSGEMFIAFDHERSQFRRSGMFDPMNPIKSCDHISLLRSCANILDRGSIKISSLRD